MKRALLLLTLLLVAITATNVLAQTRGDRDGDGVPDSRDQCPDTAGSPDNNGCPVFEIVPSQPPPPTDSDGDGLPDTDDQCPTVSGPRENNGCPGTDPTVPPPVDITPTFTPPPSVDITPTVPPPFRPPALPIDGCYVTPSTNNNVNVRKSPRITGDIAGFLSLGVVYESQGFVVDGPEVWFALVNYEGSTGTVGYASRTVLLTTSDCPEIDLPGNGTTPNSMDDFVEVSVALCDMSVGWDAPTWSTSEPQGESVVNMALWFAYEPGAEIPAGTTALGVIYLRGGVNLPDAENIVAVRTDPVVLDAALNSDNPVDYGYPAAAHGVQSGETIFYRLTDDIGQVGDGTGNCGPIVGDIDGFAETSSADAQPISIPIDEYACTIATSYDFIFAFNAAPGEAISVDTNPIAIVNATYVWDGWSTPASWTTSLEQADGETLQYMLNPFWASLVRIGGTCGPIETAQR